MISETILMFLISPAPDDRAPEFSRTGNPLNPGERAAKRNRHGIRGISATIFLCSALILSQSGALDALDETLAEQLIRYEPADHVRDAFLSSETFQERLHAVPGLVGAYLSEGRVRELPQLFSSAAENGESWHKEAFRAEMFVVLGDLNGEYETRRALLESNPDELPLIDRLWDLAVALEDMEGVRVYSQDLAEKSNERIHWMDYYRVLIRRKEDGPLLDAFAANGETLFSIRELFPELFSHDSLDTISDMAVEAARSGGDDWRALFALGEYYLFNRDFDRALECFKNVIRIEASESADSVFNGFSRLNRSHFSRYAAMRNLALISGAFGPDANLEYSFLGMPDRFDPESLRDARDAALLYWRYRIVEIGEPAEFLDELAGILEESGRAYGERILAMGIAGAPRYMMTEVKRYLDSGHRDADTDEFILRAVNRYAPSTERFPELRDPMVEATNIIAIRLAATEESYDAVQGLFRQRLNMLNRLGERDEVSSLARRRMEDLSEEDDIDSLWEQVGLALDIEEYTLAESYFERIQGSLEGRESQDDARNDRLNLYFAAWYSGEGGDIEQAERYLKNYIRSLGARIETSDNAAFSVRTWWESDLLPTDNPYWSRRQMAGIHEATELFQYDDRFPLFRDVLHAVAEEHADFERGAFRYLESCLFWWRSDQIAARINLTEGAYESEDPYLKFLAAFIAARDGRVEQTRAMLGQIGVEEGDRFQKRALSFLTAAEAADERAMVEHAAALAADEVPREECIAWASILLDEGFNEEALTLLSKLNPTELHGRIRDEYFEKLLASLLGMGESNRAVPIARGFLQREMPPGFDGIDTASRRKALSVLRATDEIATYRSSLEDAFELAPYGFQLTLLFAESVPFLEDEGIVDSQAEIFDHAAEMRSTDFERQIGYALWLDENEEFSRAVSVLDRLLEEDAPAVLIHDRRVVNAYEMAGALDRLAAFFERWNVPQARSIDDFYGLQPTSHLLDSIGSRLYERGEFEAAAEVWMNGVRINPVGFTEPMRIKLAVLLWREGREEDYFATLYDYLFRENPRPELWVVHPFGSVIPRWLSIGQTWEGTIEAPLLRMLEPLMEDPQALERLKDRARAWRDAETDSLSRRSFYLVALALAGEANPDDEMRDLKESVEDARKGPDASLLRQLEDWIRALSE